MDLLLRPWILDLDPIKLLSSYREDVSVPVILDELKSAAPYRMTKSILVLSKVPTPATPVAEKKIEARSKQEMNEKNPWPNFDRPILRY